LTWTPAARLRASPIWSSKYSRPRNREDDLPGGEKWRDYERFGVPVYWIVDPEARNVAQYERRDGRLVETARLVSGGVLISSLFPTITLPVDDLFANVRHGR